MPKHVLPLALQNAWQPKHPSKSAWIAAERAAEAERHAQDQELEAAAPATNGAAPPNINEGGGRQTPEEPRTSDVQAGGRKRPRSPSSPPPPDPTRRPTFTLSSFLPLPYADQETVKRWFQEFPCLARRNFYVIQNHHATAKHWDLRVQLDGSTVSFAIPKGLSGLTRGLTKVEKEGGEKLLRKAIETNPHPINYTLFEGGGVGTTLVLDVGAYRILPTKEELKERDRRRQERLDADSDDGTDSDEDDVSRGLPDDWRQEDLFSQHLHRASFQEQPARWGRPMRRPPSDLGETRSFVIELNGKRFKNLRLRFSHKSVDWQFTKKGKTRNWLITPSLHDNRPAPIEEPLGDISILTGRSMDEAKACRPAERLLLADSQWESWGEHATGGEWEGEEGIDWGRIQAEDGIGLAQGGAGPSNGVWLGAGAGAVGGGSWEEYDAVAWELANPHQ